MATYSRNGPASRAVALDLVLRTFMNSADFHVSNPKIWDNISRLVPGTSPQQCAHRWEELLLATNSAIVGDLSGLTATGRPISGTGRRQATKLVRSMFNQQQQSSNSKSSSDIMIGAYSSRESLRPHSVLSLNNGERAKELGLRRSLSSQGENTKRHISQQCSNQHISSNSNGSLTHQGEQKKSTPHPQGGHLGKNDYLGTGDQMIRNLNQHRGDQARGTFAATFCQNVLSKAKDATGGQENVFPADGEKEGEREKDVDTLQAPPSLEPLSIASGPPNMIVHVCDDAKKQKRDFICPRDILVREMCYFAEYLSSDALLWDEVDISVHCDISVFEWLMKYTKQGMLSGPYGEVLTEPLPPPLLEVNNTVSILISSEFLKMDRLVEECLEFCHDHMSSVAASPCNMACINDNLLTRLSSKYTPLQVEEIIDKKDKIKSKLFLYQLEQLFNPTYSTGQCPQNAATLYMCKNCSQLLTTKQEQFIPCVSQSLSIDIHGKVVYNHKRNSSWNINTYIRSLQLNEGLNPRDIYWRLWGLVNHLKCDQCSATFQCRDLMSCPYHPNSLVPSEGGQLRYLCCDSKPAKFSVLPNQQNGCSLRDHSVSILCTPSKTIYDISLKLRQAICTFDQSHHQQQQYVNNSSVSPRQNTTRSSESSRPKDFSLGSLLQNEDKRSHYSSPAPAHGDNSEVLSEQHTTLSLSTSSNASTSAPGSNTTTTSKQHTHDHLKDNSDLEEDEEISSTRKPVHHSTVSKTAKKKGGNRQRQSKHDSKGLNQAGDWIWNKKKSRRWNQDMQRESDERRLKLLTAQLNQQTSQTSSGGSAASNAKNKEMVTYNGGIFSKLEVQFRAQQAAKAIPLQSTQPKSFGGTRKK